MNIHIYGVILYKVRVLAIFDPSSSNLFHAMMPQFVHAIQIVRIWIMRWQELFGDKIG